MDAGARGRRLLQRREYKAKVSEFIPKELEDQFSHDENGQLVYELDLKNLGGKIKRKAGEFFKKMTSGPIMKDYPTQQQYQQSIQNKTSNQFQSYEPEGEMIDEEGKSLFSTPDLDKLKKIQNFKNNADKVFGRNTKPIEKAHYEPEGEMIEANSAQMKAMHDAKMKKMEDDKVAQKKKKVDEACWKGYEKKGMKTMFGKRYPNCVKKTKKEEVQLEAKVEKFAPKDKQADVRNERRFGKKHDKSIMGIKKGKAIYHKDEGKREENTKKRREEHKARRGVKGAEVKGGTVAKKKYKGIVTVGNYMKKEEVELEAKKSCGEGEYYCHDDQKCKPIPDGMKVGKDGMLVKEDMKGMSQKSGDKRSTESGAGMTAKGVAKYNRRTGGNLKTAVTTPPSKLKPGSKAANRRKSFCARSKSWDGPRGKAARRRWNCSFEPELPMIIDEKKKLFNTAPLSNRVSNWSKKISEASPLTPGRNDFGLPTGLKKGKGSGTTEKKVNPNNLPVVDKASYEPQGEMIERKMTSSEKDKKEKYVKGMKKDKGGFTKRYGKDGKSVMYATATKMAMKEESCGKGEYYCYDDKKCKPIPEGMKVGKDGMLVKEKYGDVPFRDGRVKKHLGGQGEIDKLVSLTPKGQQAFRNIPDPKIYSGKKLINPDNVITNLYKTKDRLTMSSYEPEGEMIKENPLTDFLNNVKKIVNKVNKNQTQKNDAINQVLPGSAGFEKKPIDLKVEGSLHKWFKGSKSKDGKGGWVNVVTGGTCASDEPGEGTPKCVSSSKRASMSKAERLSASRRKKKADPGQQSKSGAAKPTYVATDSKKKK